MIDRYALQQQPPSACMQAALTGAPVQLWSALAVCPGQAAAKQHVEQRAERHAKVCVGLFWAQVDRCSKGISEAAGEAIGWQHQINTGIATDLLPVGRDSTSRIAGSCSVNVLP